MFNPMDHPVLLLLFSLPVFWFSSWLGASFRKRQQDIQESTRSDLTLVLGGALTLLGLIIGFTYSMAVTRYDQRKNYEEEEANAIGTEYVRADYLPTAEAAKIRALLKNYLYLRILYYEAGQGKKLSEINGQTARLQSEMWTAVVRPTSAQPTPVGALVVSGMNDVLNSQGYTQAAWWNRIPIAAWTLLIVISVFCNLLIGYSVHGRSNYLLLILPIALAVSFFLIADIDSPRGGTIHVHPQNLESLAGSLNSQ
jgi:ABC-type branched-subunit amino acid transport system permease subunit